MKNIILGIIGIVVLGLVLRPTVSVRPLGQATSGLVANVASSTSESVSTTAGVIVSTSTACASRVITSRAQPLMLTFSDYAGQTPTGTFGHLQTASTTVVYDSGVYGCGLVKAYAFGTDTITVTDVR